MDKISIDTSMPFTGILWPGYDLPIVPAPPALAGTLVVAVRAPLAVVAVVTEDRIHVVDIGVADDRLIAHRVASLRDRWPDLELGALLAHGAWDSQSTRIATRTQQTRLPGRGFARQDIGLLADVVGAAGRALCSGLVTSEGAMPLVQQAARDWRGGFDGLCLVLFGLGLAVRIGAQLRQGPAH